MELFLLSVATTSALLGHLCGHPQRVGCLAIENCHEREDGDLQWDEITFEEEVNGKYWHAIIMSLYRVREDFIKKQRKMKHLDWYLTMKKASDRRNPKYYV